MKDWLRRHRFTGIDPEYPSCERAVAQLAIYPSKLELEAITKHLGASPTTAVRKGSVRKTSGKVYPRSVWSLSSEGMVRSMDLRDHIDWVLQQVDLTESTRMFLATDRDLKIAVSCIWWSRGSGGPTLWPEQMKKMSDLGLECTFDIYFFGDEDS